mmetsp:Transcript_4579/g.12965  ORF Transcript_4579/g.12965 Transcript_4579/m.12965 type:complete len:211 (-) Transcript_4579:1100-1732(-)
MVMRRSGKSGFCLPIPSEQANVGRQQSGRDEGRSEQRIAVSPLRILISIAFLYPERRHGCIGEGMTTNESIVSKRRRGNVLLQILVAIVHFRPLISIQKPILVIRVSIVIEHKVPVHPVEIVRLVVAPVDGCIVRMKFSMIQIRLLGGENVVQIRAVVELITSNHDVVVVVVVVIVVVQRVGARVMIHHILVAVIPHRPADMTAGRGKRI